MECHHPVPCLHLNFGLVVQFYSWTAELIISVAYMVNRPVDNTTISLSNFNRFLFCFDMTPKFRNKHNSWKNLLPFKFIWCNIKARGKEKKYERGLHIFPHIWLVSYGLIMMYMINNFNPCGVVIVTLQKKSTYPWCPTNRDLALCYHLSFLSLTFCRNMLLQVHGMGEDFPKLYSLVFCLLWGGPLSPLYNVFCRPVHNLTHIDN